MAQAVIVCLTSGGWVLFQVSPRRICRGLSGTGEDFLRILRHCHISYHSIKEANTYSFTYHRRYIILATDSIVKYNWRLFLDEPIFAEAVKDLIVRYGTNDHCRIQRAFHRIITWSHYMQYIYSNSTYGNIHIKVLSITLVLHNVFLFQIYPLWF
jgi:hypothetical protein